MAQAPASKKHHCRNSTVLVLTGEGMAIPIHHRRGHDHRHRDLGSHLAPSERSVVAVIHRGTKAGCRLEDGRG